MHLFQKLNDCNFSNIYFHFYPINDVKTRKISIGTIHDVCFSLKNIVDFSYIFSISAQTTMPYNEIKTLNNL